MTREVARPTVPRIALRIACRLMLPRNCGSTHNEVSTSRSPQIHPGVGRQVRPFDGEHFGDVGQALVHGVQGHEQVDHSGVGHDAEPGVPTWTSAPSLSSSPSSQIVASTETFQFIGKSDGSWSRLGMPRYSQLYLSVM